MTREGGGRGDFIVLIPGEAELGAHARCGEGGSGPHEVGGRSPKGEPAA